MAKMIQLRNVPDRLHRQLKARAKAEGLSLSKLLLREAQRLVERPTVAELRKRLESRTPIHPKVSPAEVIRQQRGR